MKTRYLIKMSAVMEKLSPSSTEISELDHEKVRSNGKKKLSKNLHLCLDETIALHKQYEFMAAKSSGLTEKVKESPKSYMSYITDLNEVEFNDLI